MNSCVIVFPLYQPPTPIELAFLENGLKLTKGYKQVIAAPEGLEIDTQFGLLQQLEIKRFAAHFFKGIEGYNQLLLSSIFYRTFQHFEYMLIHQADVYLFREELAEWCNKNFDYIGAPWFRPDKLNRSKLYQQWQKVKLFFKKHKLYAQRHNKVGNGGLSLRKVSTALKVLEKVPSSILAPYIKRENHAFNEDIFWSLEAPKIVDFKIPDWQEGMRFAVEFHPEIAYKYLNQELPFGCHAPLKYNVKFWQQFIPEIKSYA